MTASDEARRDRAALFATIDRLASDYDWAPTGQILATVALCRSELMRAGLHGDGLLAACEAMTRIRLDSRLPRPRRHREHQSLTVQPFGLRAQPG